MYDCVPENGGGFFEGVCTPSNATAHSCDPPLPTRSAREPESCWQGCGLKKITRHATVGQLKARTTDV